MHNDIAIFWYTNTIYMRVTLCLTFSFQQRGFQPIPKTGSYTLLLPNNIEPRSGYFIYSGDEDIS